MIRAEGVKLAFPDTNGRPFVVLNLARFAPANGAVTAVSGPSGSGKSTLLYVLAGLLRPDAGRILFSEEDIYSYGESRRDVWRRQRVGFVFQDFHLIPELSILANATLQANFGPGGAEARERAGQLLADLGVPLRGSVEILSRGERQRLAIARALAFDPPVILADEPTASLDDIAAADVRRILRGLAAGGRTVIVATHDQRALAEADAHLRLDHGHPMARQAAA